MKHLKVLFLAAFLLLAGVSGAKAQTFDFGIVAGMNMTKLNLSGAKANLSSSNRAGWYVGPKVYFNTVIGLGLNAALQYSERDLYIENNTLNEGQSKKYRTFEIPVNVRYNIGLGKKLGVYVSTGPQFGFALQSMSWDNFGTGNNFDRSNLNTSWNIGAGLRVANHFELGVGYNMSLGHTGKAILNNIAGVPVGYDNSPELRYRTNTFQVELAYIF